MPKCISGEETSSYRGRLADVLRVWDCYEQAWREDAPVVFRFEEADVLVWRPREAGAVRSRFCTEAEEEEALRELEAQAVFSDSCLCWRAARCKDVRLGEMMSLRLAIDLVAQGRGSDEPARRP